MYNIKKILINRTVSNKKHYIIYKNILKADKSNRILAELDARAELRKSIHFRNFGNHVNVHQTTDRLSAPQGNQCLLPYFLASLVAQEKTDCTSMVWSIDSCQNKVSADQYHLAVSQAQLSTQRGRVFCEVIRWQVTSFQIIAGSSIFS